MVHAQRLPVRARRAVDDTPYAWKLNLFLASVFFVRQSSHRYYYCVDDNCGVDDDDDVNRCR